MLASSGCSCILKPSIAAKEAWHFYLRAVASLHGKKRSISHADLLDLPHCALGKTINVKHLCSSPCPHKWDSLLGYRDNSSPSPERKWKALYPWDMINSRQAWSREERCLYSACLEGRTLLHSITFQHAFCLLSGELTEQQTACHYLIRSQSAVYIIRKEVAGDYTDAETLLKHYLCASSLKHRSQGPGVSLGKIWVNLDRA